MAPKKNKKKKAPKKEAPEKETPETSLPKTPKPGLPCICIENEEGWFCMKQLRSGELKECDGPFDTKEDCESHTCR
jgi:hypothetical protein